MAEVREGQRIGNYRLIRRLGAGGFAEVYLGEHLHIKRLAAIKLLHAQRATPALRQFRKEARIIEALRHPHIVTLFDFGFEQDGTEQIIPYLIMDFAPGGSLRQRYPQGSIVKPARVLKYIEQVAAALDFAHSHKIIHRDIKPENMLIGRDKTILLSDFGIALLTARTAESGPPLARPLDMLAVNAIDAISQSSTAQIAGTVPYMAPEQLAGQPGPASDQYALGVVAYEWLCGTRPFRGPVASLLHQHMNVDPPPLRSHNPELPAQLEHVVLTSLAKTPEQRYPSAGAFAAAFAHALALDAPARPASSHTPSPTHIPPRSSLRSPQPAPNIDKHQSISRRTLLTGLGGLAIVGGIAATAAVLFPPSAPHPNVVHGNTGNSGAGATSHAVSVGTTLYQYHGHTKSVLALAWSPRQDLIASGSLDKTVRVWHATTGSEVFSNGEHRDQVNTVAWSHNGNYLASGSNDKLIYIREALTGKLIRFYSSHQDVVSSVAWSPDDKYIASASFDKTVHVWSATTGLHIQTYQGHQDVVSSIAWSPDSKFIASASSDKTVHVWEVSTGSLSYKYGRHSGFVSSVLWSIDGKQIASASDDMSVQIWDAFTGNNSYAYSKHKGAVLSITLSPDGTRIVSGSTDQTVHIWNFTNASTILVYSKHTDAVHAATWSPNGKWVASGGDDIIVNVWQAS